MTKGKKGKREKGKREKGKKGKREKGNKKQSHRLLVLEYLFMSRGVGRVGR